VESFWDEAKRVKRMEDFMETDYFKNRKVYTKKKHAEHLVKLLESPYPCERCVATCGHDNSKFNLLRSVNELWQMGNDRKVCMVCLEFIGHDPNNRFKLNGPFCPCHMMGAEKAAKVSWLALEEKGYLGMDDKCEKCGKKKNTVGYSWFTDQDLCQKCIDDEDDILLELSQNGQNVWEYAGCGYVPKMDGSNWVEMDQP